MQIVGGITSCAGNPCICALLDDYIECILDTP